MPSSETNTKTTPSPTPSNPQSSSNEKMPPEAWNKRLRPRKPRKVRWANKLSGDREGEKVGVKAREEGVC